MNEILEPIVENPFHILGLTVSASKKEISRRAKEIQKYLKIDEIPSYKYDLEDIKQYRTENNVHQAKDLLLNRNKHLFYTYFWFSFTSQDDNRPLELLDKKDYQGLAEYLENKSSKSRKFSMLYLKDAALVFLYFGLRSNSQKSILKFYNTFNEKMNYSSLKEDMYQFYNANGNINTDEYEKQNSLFMAELSDIFLKLAVKLVVRANSYRHVKIFFQKTNARGKFCKEYRAKMLKNMLNNNEEGSKILDNAIMKGHSYLNIANYTKIISEIQREVQLYKSLFGVEHTEAITAFDNIAESIMQMSMKILKPNPIVNFSTVKNLIETAKIIAVSSSLLTDIEETRRLLEIKELEMNPYFTQTLSGHYKKKYSIDNMFSFISEFFKKYFGSGASLSDVWSGCTTILFTIGIIIAMGSCVVNYIGESCKTSTYNPQNVATTYKPSSSTNNQQKTTSESSNPVLTYVTLPIIIVNINEKSPQNFKLVEERRYRCTKKQASEILKYKPSKKFINEIRQSFTMIDKLSKELTELKAKIKKFPLNEYSEVSVDEYNRLVNIHNKKLEKFNKIAAEGRKKAISLDTKLETYNNLLIKRCK